MSIATTRQPDQPSSASPFDGIYRLEIPEQVVLEFDLAGPGSRFCALMIDYLIMIAVLIGIAALVLLLMVSSGQPFNSANPVAESVSAWGVAVLIFASFVLNFGYFAIFEWITRGQSPGKQLMGLRVVRGNGTPMSLPDLLLRNFLRVVDFMPAMYGVGGMICFFHPQHKRLGDIAAGTLVIKHRQPNYRARTDGNARLGAPTVQTVSNRSLTTEHRKLLASYLHRRDELTLQARHYTAWQLAHKFAQHYGGDPAADPDRYLDQLARQAPQPKPQSAAAPASAAIESMAMPPQPRIDLVVSPLDAQGAVTMPDESATTSHAESAVAPDPATPPASDDDNIKALRNFGGENRHGS